MLAPRSHHPSHTQPSHHARFFSLLPPSLSLMDSHLHNFSHPTSPWLSFCHYAALFLRQPPFEKAVLAAEPNDCALISKYAVVKSVDLSHTTAVSLNEISLYSIHIEHPLTKFMKKEAVVDMDVLKELSESPVLVFIHGMGGQMSQFEPLIGLLSQCAEVLAVDLPGFGDSRPKPSTMARLADVPRRDAVRITASLAQMSRDDFSSASVAAIIAAFITQSIPEGKHVVLVGHSMGCHLAVRVANLLAEGSVEGMVLMACPAFAGAGATATATTSPAASTTILSRARAAATAVLTRLPWVVDRLRAWDRLGGLDSHSVHRQIANGTFYQNLRQFRWNLDIHTKYLLQYAAAFRRCTANDVVAAVARYNDNPSDTTVYQKTLFIGGLDDQVTPYEATTAIHRHLTATFARQVSGILSVRTGHALLLGKPELISGHVLNHFEHHYPARLHLLPAWVLKVKATLSGDKWGLKNEMKWLAIAGVSGLITRGRAGGTAANDTASSTAPLLGMKTLREGDPTHSPAILEQKSHELGRTIIAVIDISADIPPYNPESFTTIRYYKCATVSKVVPDLGAVRKFIDLVDRILSESTETDPLVAVHCHYGFNRTGYLICCYLVERCGWTVAEAIDGFKRAKTPGIKHPHFVDALYVRYES